MSSTPKCNPLYVEDIFHEILNCLAEPHPDNINNRDLVQVQVPRREGGLALAALAQTCRAFSEPALSCLWRRLGSFVPLLRCLFTEEDINAGEDRLHPPSLAEWSIIYRYSHRIQELEVWDDGSLFLLECSVFEPSFLPNLRVLSWDLDRDLSLAYIQPLLCPKLLSFGFGISATTSDHKTLTSLLKTLPSRCPDLKIIRFDIDLNHRNGEMFVPVLSTAICSFQKLEQFATHNQIGSIALQRLITSPQLTHLFLTTQQLQRGQLSLCNSDTPFPGIRRISLSEPDLGSIINLLRPEGQMFSTTELNLDTSPTSELAHSFLTALASQSRRSSLRSIILNLNIYHARGIDQDNEFTLSCDTLHPLIFFHNLCELMIDLENRISLNDAELASLACGWPLLRFICLVSGGVELPTKHITLRGLLLLAIACPKLACIHLRLDARVVPTSGDGVGVCNTTVKNLYFVGSPVDDPLLVATFLLKHFPSIVHVAESCRLRPGYREKWRQVEQFLEEAKVKLPGAK